MSMTLPLPSSPHWSPMTAEAAPGAVAVKVVAWGAAFGCAIGRLRFGWGRACMREGGSVVPIAQAATVPRVRKGRGVWVWGLSRRAVGTICKVWRPPKDQHRSPA